MKSNIESVYILENPEKSITQFATGYQLRYEDIIKEVFGVACIQDVQMMIQFNKGFQTSILKRDHINEQNLSIDRIIRVATKTELLQLRKQLLEKQENESNIPCPFAAMIILQDGIFKWDASNSSYISVKLGA